MLLLAISFLPRGVVGIGAVVGRRFARRSASPALGPPMQAPGAAPAQALPAHPRQPGDVALDAADITVHFGGNVAVDSVSIRAVSGEIRGIVGPNGAGKTTLFNCITGLVKPSAGAITFAGRDITALAPSDRARLGILRTFQTPKLFGSLSVAANVEIGYVAGKLAESASRMSPDAAMEAVGVAHLASHEIRLLTTGQRRLVEMARVVAAGPRIMLVDEVFAGLTSAEADQVMRTLRICRDGGAAVLLIEHVLTAVRALVDHLYVLERGRVIGEGEPRAVLDMKEVRTAYLGKLV
jgi:ABC-type branched-subunit amino acid transport system ATPase component